MIISVIGGSNPTKSTYALAERVGAELAKRGITVVCGGLSGVMEGVCKGAWENGGLTIGILPGDDRKRANSYVSIRIPTGLGIARNALVVKAGEAVIALDGEYGTLSEIAIALAERVPVVLLAGRGVLQSTGIPDPDVIVAIDPADAAEKAATAATAAALKKFEHWRCES